MDFGYTPNIVATLSAAAICIVLSAYAWTRHSRAPEAVPLALLMLAVTAWLVAYAFGLTSLNLQTKVFWAKVEYIGITSVPLLLAVYATYRARRQKWLTPHRLALLAIIPIVTLLLMWTNEKHGLIWDQYSVYREGSTMLAEKTYGTWFWVHASYSYLLLLGASILIIRSAIVLPSVYRWQNITLALALLVPWVGSMAYVSGIIRPGGLDPTPFAFAFSGLMLTFALFGLRLLDIVPVARDTVVDVMSDAVLVLDTQNRIVDLNPSAQLMLGLDVSQAVGRQVSQILPDQLNLGQASEELRTASSAVAYVEGGEERYYDISITSLNDGHGALAGRLVVFHNITDRKRLEQQTQEAYEKEAAAYQELEAEMKRRVEFTRALIHELKTPLTPMVASSQLLIEQAKDETLLSLAQNVSDGASRLNQRIDELLDVAKGELGVLGVNPRELDALQFLHRVAKEVGPLAASAGVSVQLELPASLPEIQADESRLRQVLHNLF